MTYTNFAAGEPNANVSDEDFVHIVPVDVPAFGFIAGEWNDNINNQTIGDFFGVVEVVPEPASAALLAAGGLLLLGRRRASI